MKALFSFIFSLFVLLASAQKSLSSYVDPFIGTGGHGHTFPGATTPFGMMQLSPDTRIDGSWDGCGGYHYNDSLVYGFSHTHLSGTGCSDYGDIAVLPLTGKPREPKKSPSQTDLKKVYAVFNHKNEKASAGYYAVDLNNKIQCEFTASTRVGFHQYTFAENSGRLVVKLDHRDKTLASGYKIISPNIIEGYRRSEAWAKDEYIFFRMEFSADFIVEEQVNGEIISDKKEQSAGKTGNSKYASGIFLGFKNLPDKKLKVKVAISFVSEEGAHKNLETEIPHWDFEKVKTEANAAWEKELGKIVINGDDEEKKKIFYTALYHCMIQPNIASDVDGSYRGRDNRIHKMKKGNYYSVFSLWDTFRGEHPLFTVIEQKRTSDFVKTFLLQYQQGGRLPVWELAGNETDCMIGYHSVSVISDAIMKGIRDFDMHLALEAMKKSATWNHLGLPAYMKQGFIATEDDNESVSKTLEYSYDDWCIAQTAKLLGKRDDYIYYMRRSQSWKNVFDPEAGFMRPRKNGGWYSPFDPKEVNNYFTEGNSWQYSFFVPHDVYGLIDAIGGEQKFEEQLDKLFSEDSKTNGRQQADITGLIGQYAHGNEPSHHMAYLYNYIGKPRKTQNIVTRILNEMYKPSPDGLCGNEDCGQMSAWYVLSAMGFYQVCPGSGFFEMGMPLFDKVEINLENGKQFSLEVKNPEERKKEPPSGIAEGMRGCRLSNVSVDGLNLSWTKLSYEKIAGGSKVECTLTNNPIAWWENQFEDKPPVPEKDFQGIWRVPAIITSSQTFRDSILVTIKNYEPTKKLFYTTDTSANITTPYSGPFWIKNSVIVRAAVIKGSERSAFATSFLYKIPHNWNIALQSRYDKQYSAGGDEGIIDGLRADTNWRKGGWQGYQNQDFEAVIDMKEMKDVNEVSAGFLQDTRSWILMPKKVEYSFSSDGKKFSKMVVVMNNNIKDNDYSLRIKDFSAKLQKPVKARYVKVKAINYGKLPVWHQGAGGDAYIFVDEVEVR